MRESQRPRQFQESIRAHYRLNIDGSDPSIVNDVLPVTGKVKKKKRKDKQVYEGEAGSIHKEIRFVPVIDGSDLK